MLKKLAIGLVFALTAVVAQAEDYKAGINYDVIAMPVPTADKTKVEVVEAFGYLCPHCASFEPMLHSWTNQLPADVNFGRVPVVFSRSWEPLARAYYSSELLNDLDKTHQATFTALHNERRRFNSLEDLADFYADLGVDKEKFIKMNRSFAVNMRMNQGVSKLKGYGVQSVPTLIVNGKYRITADKAGGHAGMLKVAEYLIEQEKKTL
ncbi:thiol:disulfide interchange protein DsbA/DsbL [Amphritea sp. 2_MG-2023]|jgi:thiol:disulfide interchange protein DsbA|uniref:thiol:disulfide interchange protein DsbA/DsbL n=1 Tax=Amphritea TaxID=515417 RepID=UPI001C0661C9|nr:MULTISPECIES: thiol:disulfide interchange protein DsbA/DsbL [Amphritea]MBU2967740.1 thiol:disulfide interchange protein DsbA/DsbL [Amphritea atlantica]MDO6416942.1 thiol:disulfide interchange protein DsbA/DsbL [Amphritea sp. 2_MG-2023]MDX2421883.1 thiol:disulfide interchange protein DsbA/DsbL [Amphritea sp.]